MKNKEIHRLEIEVIIIVSAVLALFMLTTGCSTAKASSVTTMTIPMMIPQGKPVIRVVSMDPDIEYEATVVEDDGFTWTGGFTGKTVVLLDIPLSVVPKYWEQSTDLENWNKTAPIKAELLNIDEDGIMHYQMTFSSIDDLDKEGNRSRQFFRLTYL